MRSPWNKTDGEWGCPDCGCWSLVGEDCWNCTEIEEDHETEIDAGCDDTGDDANGVRPGP